MLARALAGGTRLIGLLRRAKQLRQADRAQLERQRRRRRVWMRRRLGAQPHCRSRPVRRNGGHAELGLVPAQGKCVPFEPPGDSRMALLQSLQPPCNAPTGLAWGTHWRWSASMSSRKLSESKNPSESSLRGTNHGTQGTNAQQYSQCLLTVRRGLFSVTCGRGRRRGSLRHGRRPTCRSARAERSRRAACDRGAGARPLQPCNDGTPATTAREHE